MRYLDDFLEYLRVIKKHSINTIKNYESDILEFSSYIKKDYLNIDKIDVSNYLNYLYEKKYKKSSISRKLSSLRTFYNYLLNKNIINNNYFKSIKNPKKDNILPKYLDEEMVDKMFLVPFGNSSLGLRNHLIIRMLYATGLRVSELVNIKVKDIDVSERTIMVFGKGSKERIVVFGNNTKDILEKYLSMGRGELNKKNSPYLFLNKDGNRLSDRYVRKIIDDIIIRASIEKHVSPHTFRHTFATHLLNNGADLVSVKDLLGHESLNTTSIYTHVSNEMIRKVYDNAHPRAHE